MPAIQAATTGVLAEAQSLCGEIGWDSLWAEIGKGARTMSKSAAITREQLIKNLNGDLAREYQAIIAYVTYSQVLKGAQYMNIARELEVHAGEELAHALLIAKQIDYLGGTPTVTPEAVKSSKDAKVMLEADLQNELTTI